MYQIAGAAQMKELDRQAIEEYGVSSLGLMERAARAVARQLGLLQERTPGWSLSAITADPGFERALGRRGDKRRRFYNGRLECELITYYPTDQRGKST